jgi:hypothetical protein
LKYTTYTAQNESSPTLEGTPNNFAMVTATKEDTPQADVHEEPEVYSTAPPDASELTMAASPFKNPNKLGLRSGRWFPEEERYANRLVAEFRAGNLPLPEKITLREFLSRIFHCPPMRITKKFEGNNMIGKVTYKRRGNLTPMAYWELKELERKFWERMVKSKSPSALEAHEKMVEYSAQVFPESDAPALGELEVQDGENLHRKGPSIGQIQNMFIQLKHMLQPVVGIGGARHYNEFATDNIAKLETMLEEAHKKHLDLNAMSEIPDLSGDKKSLIDNACSHIKIDIEDIEAMLQEATYAQQHGSDIKNFSMATANMLTLQQMVNDSKHKLFQMELNAINLSDHLAADHDSLKPLLTLIDQERNDVEILESQLLGMKVEINQKYKGAY